MYIVRLLFISVAFAAIVWSLFISSPLLQSAVLNMKNFVAPIFYALSLLHTVFSYIVYDLSDAEWTLTDSAGNVSVPGSLPSQVLSNVSVVSGDHTDRDLRRILTYTRLE